MTLAATIFGLWLLGFLFAIALCRSASRADELSDAVWPVLVDEEGRR